MSWEEVWQYEVADTTSSQTSILYQMHELLEI